MRSAAVDNCTTVLHSTRCPQPDSLAACRNLAAKHAPLSASCSARRSAATSTATQASTVRRLTKFAALRSETQQCLLDSQCQFTCSALLPTSLSSPSQRLVALGTTLGHICIVSHTRLLSSGKQRLRDVLRGRWAAHAGGVHALCCAGAGLRCLCVFVSSYRCVRAGGKRF